MDDPFHHFHRLTVRSWLYNFWHRFLLHLTGARYTLKLLQFTYQNVLVLRHFQRCREVEAAVLRSKKTRFPYRSFYKQTWQKSRKLFAPVRTSVTQEPQTHPSAQTQTYPAWYATDVEKELPAFSWSSQDHTEWLDAHPGVALSRSVQPTDHSHAFAAQVLEDEEEVAVHTVSKPRGDRNRIQQPYSLVSQRNDLSLHVVSHACHHHSHTATLTKRKGFRLRAALRKGFLTIWHAPRVLLWKLSTFFRTYIFKVKLRGLYQRQQFELLRERQRLIASTQTALFLSLANTIDLHTTRELTTLCQHVSRARRKRKMTEEDLACFDQSVTELDNNHDTLRHAA